MRPTIDEEVVERVEAIVDREARVPADHLTFNQKVAFLAESHEELAEDADLSESISTLQSR